MAAVAAHVSCERWFDYRSRRRFVGPTRWPSHSEKTSFDQVTQLIEQTRAGGVAVQANAALTLMNWEIGRLIDEEVLQRERADYAKEIVALLGQQLTERYGRGFARPNLYRMVQFSQLFPDQEIVVTLSRQLSWSHFLVLLSVRRAEARAFYIDQMIIVRLGVRALRELIGRQGFERKEIANVQSLGGSVIPADSFRDPYFLDFLGPKDAYEEKDLEEAIIREMEPFLLEVGHGWAFVERQKRMVIGDDDFHLELLFYSRPLRRLIAVELKIGHFIAAYEGHMKLYLKWLDKYERQEGEEAPVGLILCTEESRERVDLLKMHKNGIVVAEYWTALPPKAELQARIREIYNAAVKVARRTFDERPNMTRQLDPLLSKEC